MKTNRRYLLLLALMAVLSGCSEEGLPGKDNHTDGNGNNSGQTFSINVYDGGYASADAPSTRATTDNNYQTGFVTGDKIGVYAVKNSAIVSGISNVCLTKASNGSWTIPAGTALPAEATYSYYAYYPWQSSYTSASVIPSGATADTFFGSIVGNWTPATDQGDATKYGNQDLMIAKGTVSGTSLSFSMTHKMALVVIDPPESYKYKLATDAGYTWTATVTPAFSGFTPYSVNNTYRYLVKPAQSRTFSGTCVSSFNEAWSLSNVSISAGQYKKLTIDGGSGGTVKEKSYTLQVGDFYMNDGSLKSKDATLTSADVNNCIGVVYCVDKSFITSYGTKGSKYSHALVVVLKDMPDSDTGEFLMGPTDAISSANSYESIVPAPATSSSWYLPNLDELKYICWGNNTTQSTNGKSLLEGQFGKLNNVGTGSADDFYIDNVYEGYWSSKKNSVGKYYTINFIQGREESGFLGSSKHARASLAF